jgi:predicted permease
LLWEDDWFFWIDGKPKPASQSEMNTALVYIVEPGYLTTMGIPLKQGRFFTGQDNERSPNVAVIDEALAKKYFGAENPIGKRIHLGDDEDSLQIVGVVGHTKQWDLGPDENQPLQTQLYIPFRAMSDDDLRGGISGVNVMMRSDGAGLALWDSIRGAVQSHNSQNIITRPQTMNDVIAGSLARRRFSMTLLNAFAAVALLLASVGLYGVISYLVGQRTHELGVRIALGAGRREVLRLVINHGMKMALGGVAIGLIAAFGLTRLMANMLYGVSPTDPVTFAAIALLLAAVAMAACLVPAWRATKVDPLVALRHE